MGKTRYMEIEREEFLPAKRMNSKGSRFAVTCEILNIEEFNLQDIAILQEASFSTG